MRERGGGGKEIAKEKLRYWDRYEQCLQLIIEINTLLPLYTLDGVSLAQQFQTYLQIS